jgi:hypothetical protein
MSTGLLTGEDKRQANFLLGPWVHHFFLSTGVDVANPVQQLVGSCLDLILQGVLSSQVCIVYAFLIDLPTNLFKVRELLHLVLRRQEEPPDRRGVPRLDDRAQVHPSIVCLSFLDRISLVHTVTLLSVPSSGFNSSFISATCRAQFSLTIPHGGSREIPLWCLTLSLRRWHNQLTF